VCVGLPRWYHLLFSVCAGTETLHLQLLRHSLAATTTDRAVDTVKNMWSSDHNLSMPTSSQLGTRLLSQQKGKS